MNNEYSSKPPPREMTPRARKLEFLTGFAGWFALFSAIWLFGSAFSPVVASPNSTCLIVPVTVDLGVSIFLIMNRKKAALAGFLCALLLNGIGVFFVAILGISEPGYALPALVLHVPFYFPFFGA